MKISELLIETKVAASPKLTSVNVESAIKMLNTHCKDALWMLEHNTPFYRGFKDEKFNSAFTVVDPSKTERASSNTTNHYTVILDNNPLAAKFPKRSRCYIASTSFGRANNYSGTGWPKVLIPFDDVKIGVVNSSDIWDTTIKIFGDTSDIEGMNNVWANMGIPSNIEAFQQFEQLLNKNNRLAQQKFKRFFPYGDPKNFMKQVFDAYGPKNTGFTVHTTATLPKKLDNSEVWIGGKVMIIDVDTWKKMFKAFNLK